MMIGNDNDDDWWYLAVAMPRTIWHFTLLVSEHWWIEILIFHLIIIIITIFHLIIIMVILTLPYIAFFPLPPWFANTFSVDVVALARAEERAHAWSWCLDKVDDGYGGHVHDGRWSCFLSWWSWSRWSWSCLWLTIDMKKAIFMIN